MQAEVGVLSDSPETTSRPGEPESEPRALPSQPGPLLLAEQGLWMALALRAADPPRGSDSPLLPPKGGRTGVPSGKELEGHLPQWESGEPQKAQLKGAQPADPGPEAQGQLNSGSRKLQKQPLVRICSQSHVW